MTYSQQFYDRVNDIAERSARPCIAAITEWHPIESVVDFGCGEGAWLGAWRAAGALRVRGLDGNWVDSSRLRIARDEFVTADLATPIDLGVRYDLAQCVEVAEHLPASAAPVLVATLCRHAPLILFSAAPPGQGGEHHINEQPYAYWQAMFAKRDFRLFDCLRPRIAAAREVAYWFRYNLFLYAAPAAMAALPATVRASEIRLGTAIPDVAPALHRARRHLVRLVPTSLQTRLARLRAQI